MSDKFERGSVMVDLHAGRQGLLDMHCKMPKKALGKVGGRYKQAQKHEAAAQCHCCS